jgi:hypothetical protein
VIDNGSTDPDYYGPFASNRNLDRWIADKGIASESVTVILVEPPEMKEDC